LGRWRGRWPARWAWAEGRCVERSEVNGGMMGVEWPAERRSESDQSKAVSDSEGRVWKGGRAISSDRRSRWSNDAARRGERTNKRRLPDSDERERGEPNREQNGRTTAPTSTRNEAIEWQNSNSRFF
jgi:hypothetical protein